MKTSLQVIWRELEPVYLQVLRFIAAVAGSSGYTVRNLNDLFEQKYMALPNYSRPPPK